MKSISLNIVFFLLVFSPIPAQNTPDLILKQFESKTNSEGFTFFISFERDKDFVKRRGFVLGLEIIDLKGNSILNYEPKEVKDVPKNELKRWQFWKGKNCLLSVSSAHVHNQLIINKKKGNLASTETNILYNEFYPDPLPGTYTIKIRVYSIGSLGERGKLAYEYTQSTHLEFPKYFGLKDQNIENFGLKVTGLKNNYLKFSFYTFSKLPMNYINKGIDGRHIMKEELSYDITLDLYDSLNNLLYSKEWPLKPTEHNDTAQTICLINMNEISLFEGDNQLKVLLTLGHKNKKIGIIDIDSLWHQHKQPQLFLVSVDVKNLAVAGNTGADSRKFGKHKTPDVYWKIKVEDSLMYRTSFNQNSLYADPGIITYKTENPKEFTLQIWDHDVWNDDFISEITFPLNIAPKKTHYNTPLKWLN